MNSQVLGTTYQGRPIKYFHFGLDPSHAPWILFLGGVHGDEMEGVWLLEDAVQEFSDKAPHFWKTGLGIIPRMNPDGIEIHQRLNARQVDLNRNLPTLDWTAEIKNPKYPPGPAPSSEVENQVLVKLISLKRPCAILSAHSFHRYQININGPSRDWGESLSALCGYPVTEDIGYPTPGCLGTYAGRELQIPTITLEIERGLTKEKVLEIHKPLLMETIRFWSQKGNNP